MATLKWYYPGFLQKKATVREFVFLLTLGLIGYAALHLLIPSRPKLSLKADEARVLVLKEIDTIRKELDQKLGSTGTQTASPTPTGTQTASPTPTGTQTASPTPAPPNLLPEETVKKWKQNLEQNLLIFLQERPNKQEEIRALLKTLSQDFTELEKALKQPTNLENNKKISTNIKDDLTKLKDYLEEPIFWTGNAKWIEVIIWSLFGTLVFLIQQTSQYYLREEDSNNSEESTTTLLTRRKPQYYSLIIQSPFISLVILWILSLAQFNIAGVSLVFDSIPEEVLVSLAFVLGLYNPVATTQLSMIVGAIFKDAWQKTLRKIEISPSYEIVEYGNSKQFSVIPDVKVKWSIWSQPAFGVIDAATGMYIAPPAPGFSYAPDGQLSSLKDQNPNNLSPQNPNNLSPCVLTINDQSYYQVIIRAVREDEEFISALALVMLKKTEDPDPFYKKFKIEPPSAIVEYGNCRQFSVTPDVKVKWSIWSQPALGVIDAATGMYVAPPAPGYFYDLDGQLTPLKNKSKLTKNNYQQVVICAVGEDKNPFSALAIVILKRPEDPNPSWVSQKEPTPLPPANGENGGNGEDNPETPPADSTPPPTGNGGNGGNGDDTLTGNGGNGDDTLTGNGGNGGDTLTGNGGNGND